MEEKQPEGRYIHCPKCGALTDVKVFFDTVLIKFPLCCPECSKETRINVVQFKMVEDN